MERVSGSSAKFVPENVLNEALELRAQGFSWRKIGGHFRPRGYGEDCIRRRVDQFYAERSSKRDRSREREGRRVKRLWGYRELASPPMTEKQLAEYRERMIPLDTRDLTARTMGDPIPNDPRRMQV